MGFTVSLAGLFAFCFSIVQGTSSAPAAEYYVSTSGSDADPGTSERPFRTITHAYTEAAPGVTIHVMPGAYSDYTRRWGIRLNKSGTAVKPIVLQSEVRGGAIIDGQNASDRNQGFYIEGSYNTVKGFEIRNCPHGGLAIYGDGNRVINNEIHHNGNLPSASDNGQDGAYSNEETKDNLYAGNSIHDNGRPGSNLDHGLYLCGRNETVINNVLFRNAASGLQIAGYRTVRNMKVCNNVIAWNGTSGIILWKDMDRVDIKNNIIYQNGHYGIVFHAATGGGVVLDHNLLFHNGHGDYDFTDGGSTCSHTLGATVSADPQFVCGTSAGFNAHIRSGSPAARTGLNLSPVLNADREGVPRPATGPWDLGAYVCHSSARPPTNPGDRPAAQ